MMRFYTQAHRFYCGVDLHTRTLSLCVLDRAGQTRFEKNIPPGRMPSSKPSGRSAKGRRYALLRSVATPAFLRVPLISAQAPRARAARGPRPCAEVESFAEDRNAALRGVVDFPRHHGVEAAGRVDVVAAEVLVVG